MYFCIIIQYGGKSATPNFSATNSGCNNCSKLCITAGKCCTFRLAIRKLVDKQHSRGNKCSGFRGINNPEGVGARHVLIYSYNFCRMQFGIVGKCCNTSCSQCTCTHNYQPGSCVLTGNS